MAVNAELQLLLTAKDTTPGPFRKLKRQLTDLNKSVGKVAQSFRGISAGNLVTALGFGALSTATAGVGLQFDMLKENAELAFQTLLKDGAKGTAFLAQLQKFAETTPFELEGLIDSSRQLLAMGFAADQILPVLTDIGDAVGAMGGGADTMERVTRAFGQMQTKGKASAEEIMQLTEAGIPAWDILRDHVLDIFPQLQKQVQSGAMTMQQAQGIFAGPKGMERLQKAVSGGKVSSAAAITALRKGMAERFGGLGAKQAGTMSGMLSNLSDAWKGLMGDMVQGAFGPGKTAIDGLTDMLKGLRGTVDSLPDSFKQVLGIGTVLAGGLGAIGGLTGGVGGVLGSLFSGGAGGSNPILPLLLAAVVAIGLLMLPLEGIWNAVKGALHVLVDNWPSGGGGGGGGGPGFPTGTIPVIAEIVLKPGSREETQRQIDALGAFQGKLGLVPTPAADVQRQIDPWALIKRLTLTMPIIGDLQRVLDAAGDLRKALDLALPSWDDVQRQVDKLPSLSKSLSLMAPAWSAIQGIIDGWPALSKALGLTPTTPGTIQAQIDAWPVPQKALGLMPTAPETIQGQVDSWPALTKGLDLVTPDPAAVQAVLDAWDQMLLKTGLTIPTRPQQQAVLDEDYAAGFQLGSYFKLPDFEAIQEILSSWFLRLGTWFQLPNGGEVQQAVDNAYDTHLDTWLKIPPQQDVQRGLEQAYPNLSLGAKLNITPPSWLPGGVTAVPGGGASGFVNGSPLPKFAMGGVVPGPTGAASLAMVHGGETITPAGRGGTTVVVQLNAPVYGFANFEDAVVSAVDRASRRGRL